VPFRGLPPDFDRRLITITAALDYSTRKEGTPKSANSAAPLHMPGLLEKRLRTWLDRHYKPNPDGYLFLNAKGRPFRSENVNRRIHRIMDKLGIARPKGGIHVGCHAFRHGVTTELLQAGTPIHLVTRMMRHGDPHVTLAHYAHVLPNAERVAAEQLSQRIGAQLDSESQLDPDSATKTA
jgi:integrase